MKKKIRGKSWDWFWENWLAVSNFEEDIHDFRTWKQPIIDAYAFDDSGVYKIDECRLK